MKLSVAIADKNALFSAFVVFRGIKESIKKAAKLGYDGVELALKNAQEVNPTQLNQWLKESNMQVSCISTGQVFAESGLMFTESNLEKRKQIRQIFRDFIDLAVDFGQMVNIGRVRGQIGNQNPQKAEQFFIDMARDLCEYALPKNVQLILEPVNRYEIDFINSIEQGVDLMKKVDMPNMKLMPDVFHMNIEDKTIGGELAKYIDYIAYIHFADSNRLAPGQGHTDFEDIMTNLTSVNYNGWVSVEILPKPDPETAARQAAEYLIPMIKNN